MSTASGSMSRAAKKNVKRRAAKRKLADNGSEDPCEPQSGMGGSTVNEVSANQLVNGTTGSENGTAPPDASANVDAWRTRMKHLQRKLKEIGKLEESRSKGNKLEQCQIVKLKQKGSMLDEMYELEAKIKKVTALAPSTSSTTATAAATTVMTSTTTTASEGHATTTASGSMATTPSAAVAAPVVPAPTPAGVAAAAASAAAAGYPVLPLPLCNPLLPLPGNMPYFLPSMMVPPPQPPNMMGYFPPVPPFPPVPMGAPLPVPDSTALPTQAAGTGEVRPATSAASPTAGSAPNPATGVMAQPPMMMPPFYPPTGAVRTARRPSTKIVIRDPETGDDVTEKILGKPVSQSTGAAAKDSASSSPASASGASSYAGSNGDATSFDGTSSSAKLAEQVALLGIGGATTPSAPSSPIGPGVSLATNGLPPWSSASESTTYTSPSSSKANGVEAATASQQHQMPGPVVA